MRKRLLMWLIVALALGGGPAAAAAELGKGTPLYQGKSAEGWADALRDGDTHVRVQAVLALGHLGEPAVGPLTGALGNSEPEVRDCAATVLAGMVPGVKTAAPGLLAALKGKDPVRQTAAALALGRIDTEALPREAVRPLIEAIQNPDVNVRAEAATALASFGPGAKEAVPALAGALRNDKDIKGRLSAGFALRTFGPSAAEAVPALLQALGDDNESAREMATVVLGRMGKGAVPGLVEALRTGKPDVRRRAADSLYRIGPPAAGAVPALAEALKDDEAPVRAEAALALGRIGTTDAGVVQRLGALLKDADPGARQDAATALRLLGHDARGAAPALIEALKDPQEDVRRKAARALGELGPRAAGTVPALGAALKDEDPIVRAAAASALGQLGEPAAAALAGALRDGDVVVRREAAQSLARIGADAGAAVPALSGLLKDRDAGVRCRAARALGAMGPQSKAAAGALEPLLKDTDAEVRRAAAEALHQIDGRSPAAAGRGEEPADPVRPAVERGLARIEQGMVNWVEHQRCASCHHTLLGIATLAAARQRGFAVDPDRAARQKKFLLDTYRPKLDKIRNQEGLASTNTEAGYVLLALAAADSSADDTRAALAQYLLLRQNKDGGEWRSGVRRPPIEGSSFTATAQALRGLKAVGPAGDDRVRSAIDRGRRWLLESRPVTTEDKVFRLRGLVDGGAAPEQVAAARDALLKEQRPDGSWAQLATTDGDAYATGSVLMALRAAGVPPTDVAYRKAVRRLLELQGEDGAWVVETRSTPVIVYFDNGDPGAMSQFVSMAATNWAVQALLETYPAR